MKKNGEDDSTIISDLFMTKNNKGDSFATTSSKNQGKIIELFLFVVTNSDVEWSVVRAKQDKKNTFGVGTAHNPNHSIAFENFGFKLNEIITEIHSHVNTDSFADQKGSLYGDRTRYQTYFLRVDENEEMYNYYIYMRDSGNLWSIDGFYSKGKYIRNIKGNFKRFFFGTINTK